MSVYYTDAFDPDVAAAIDAGELYGCLDCREVSEANYCPSCDEGCCAICGEIIKKGQDHTRVDDDVFCSDPRCAEIADEPTVMDLAGRLASGGAS